MDSKGNIYDQVDQEKKLARNIETGKTVKISDEHLTELPPEAVDKLKSMNRKERRAWLSDYKKQLAKIRRES